jgi:hypothetical protein
MSLSLALDVANSKMRELNVNSTGALKCDSSATTQPVSGAFYPVTQPVSVASTLLVDASATTQPVSVAGTLTVDGSATTQPVTAVSLPLPTGAATEASLSILSGSVTAGVVQVSQAPISTVASVVLGSLSGSTWTGASISADGNLDSSVMDVNESRLITISGNCSNPSGSVSILVSHDNVNYFELESEYLNVDYTSGDFGKTIEVGARYVKINRHNDSVSTETVKAVISRK